MRRGDEGKDMRMTDQDPQEDMGMEIMDREVQGIMLHTPQRPEAITPNKVLTIILTTETPGTSIEQRKEDQPSERIRGETLLWDKDTHQLEDIGLGLHPNRTMETFSCHRFNNLRYLHQGQGIQ